MSITAEKIEQIARVIDPYAFDESGMTVDLAADAEWQTQGQRRDNARDTARAILSLLQQGEPEGWRKALEEIKALKNCFDPFNRAGSYDRGFGNAIAAATKIADAALSASPLPPATEQGWRPIETAPKDGTKIITFAPDGGIEVSFYYADTLENGTAYETWRDDGCEPTHWMPLPPAPGAETGASSSRQAVLEEAHPVWRGDVRCAPELGGCWIDDQGKCQHCGFQYERKK